LKVFSLAHFLNTGVLHAFEGPMDSLPLGIEDGALQCDVDMRLHAARL
jgi:hypothetical protein